MKRVAVVAAVASVALVATGCSTRKREADDVRRFMSATVAVPRSFVYAEHPQVINGDQADCDMSRTLLAVSGQVEDDFRYRALLSVRNTPALEEAVRDDALADHVLDIAGLNALLRPGTIADPNRGAPVQVGVGPASPGSSENAATLQALQNHQWVLDNDGAPNLLPTATEKHPIGADPIFDALTVFRYADNAMHDAFEVVKFNKDSLQYKPKEDPFPTPKAQTGVTRYDLVRKRVPRLQDQSPTGQAVPAPDNFRKMSIYVKDGRILQILEDIDVVSRLKDLRANFNLNLAGKSVQQAVQIVTTAINGVRTPQGLDAIRPRCMSFKVVDPGRPHTVAMPSEAVPGSLVMLVNRGRIPARAQPAGPVANAG